MRQRRTGELGSNLKTLLNVNILTFLNVNLKLGYLVVFQYLETEITLH